VAKSGRAQVLPSRPIALSGGRVTIAADAAVSVSTSGDEYGYFNYTSYDHNLLRLFRVGFGGTVQPSRRLAVLGEVRAETAVDRASWNVRTYALFARMRPWDGRAVVIQAGLIPPSFGTSARRSYGNDNPLVGFPLAYQYLTPLRSDAVPASADDLLRMRGRGWRASYPTGRAADSGLPIVDGLHWAPGAQVVIGSGVVTFSAALTAGSLSAPRMRGGGAQVSARLAITPIAGLALGVSAAAGHYLSDEARAAVLAAGGADRSLQRGFGCDAEYARGYWVLRAEWLVSGWDVPTTRPPRLDGPVWASAIDLEARYKIKPGLYAAARIDHLRFSRITGTLVTDTWESNVTRIEAGGGYSLQRNAVVKMVYQRNWRDGGYVRTASVAAVQLLFWL
jgi:hypothetical protein